jgi:hypothetical protein
MQQTVEPLSLAQERFADAHHAKVGPRAKVGAAVFFYEKHETGVERWLVDRWGHVLDTTWFQRRAA